MIFTERTITIRNDSSSMNAPVVLYRGDKNVEVRFTLVESPYKYSNRDSINIIESANASYAQLVIKTPNDRDPIFGDITAVGKSNVVFIIGYDMIDEIEEVGTYSFQIRLFDADQTSMVTIPEVVGGFIIREPIAKEDTNNNITNSAIVGSAVVTNDLEIPTFVGGSYNKSAWYDGVVISRQKLDKIEDGIYETYELSKVNNSQIKEKANLNEVRKKDISITLNDCDSEMLDAIQGGEGTSFELLSIPRDNSVTPKKTSFVTEYGNVFNKDTITVGKKIQSNGTIIDDSSFSISDKIYYEGQEIFTRNVLNYLRYKSDGSVIGTGKPSPTNTCDYFIVSFAVGTEDSVIVAYNKLDKNHNIVIDGLKLDINSEVDIKNKSISTKKLEDKVITPEKTTFIKKTVENLCELSEEVLSVTVNSGGTPTITTTSNGIEITIPNGNKTFYVEVPVNNIGVAHIWNCEISGIYSNLSVVSSDKSTVLSSTIKTSFTPTTDTIFVKFTISVAGQTVVLSKIGVYEGTDYNEQYYLDEDIAKAIKFDTGYDNLEVFNKDNSNLFSEDLLVLHDTQFTSSGYTQNMDGWSITDYIEVDSTKTYYISGDFKVAALWGYYQTYDANKNKVDNRLRFDQGLAISLNENVKYIKLNTAFLMYINSGKTIYFSENNCLSRYGYNIPKMNLMKKNVPPQFYKWYGKKFCAYGDSNTGNKMWQPFVIDKFGMEYVHLGAGGTTAVGRCTDEELAKIPLDTDVITINFGTNDASKSIPVGELPAWKINSEYEWDTTTYIGALCTIVKYISTNIPKCRIIIISPIFRSQNIWSDPSQSEFGNAYNFDLYVKACKDIAERFGCEYLNGYQMLGANLWNCHQFFLNEGDNGLFVHLNELGGKRFAQKVINKLIEIEPIE